MIDWLFYILLAPLDWAVNRAAIFAVTAPYNQIFTAMGIAFVLMVVLIWSMLPKKAKSHNIETVLLTPYQATDEDEQEARKILTEARA